MCRGPKKTTNAGGEEAVVNSDVCVRRLSILFLINCLSGRLSGAAMTRQLRPPALPGADTLHVLRPDTPVSTPAQPCGSTAMTGFIKGTAWRAG